MSGITQPLLDQRTTEYKSAFSGKKLVGWQEKLKIIGIVAFVAILGGAFAYAAVRGGGKLMQIAGLSHSLEAGLRHGILAFVGATGFVVGAYFATRAVKVIHEKVHGHSKVEKIMDDWRAKVVKKAADKILSFNASSISKFCEYRKTALFHKAKITQAARAVVAAKDSKTKFKKYLALRHAVNQAMTAAKRESKSQNDPFNLYLDQVALAIVAPFSQEASQEMTQTLFNEYGISFEESTSAEDALHAMNTLTEEVEADNLRGAAAVANKIGHLHKMYTSVAGHVDCLGSLGSLGFNSYSQGNSDMGGSLLQMGEKKLAITFGAGFSPSDQIGQWLFERGRMAYMNLQRAKGAGEGVRVREMRSLDGAPERLEHGSTELGIWKVLEDEFVDFRTYGECLKEHIRDNQPDFPSTAQEAVDFMVNLLENADLDHMTDIEKKQAMQIGVIVVSALDFAKTQLTSPSDDGEGSLFRVACKQTYDRAAMINQGLFFLAKLGSGNGDFSKADMGMLGQIHCRTIVGDRRIMFEDRYEPGMSFVRALLAINGENLRTQFRGRYSDLRVSVPATEDGWSITAPLQASN